MFILTKLLLRWRGVKGKVSFLKNFACHLFKNVLFHKLVLEIGIGFHEVLHKEASEFVGRRKGNFFFLVHMERIPGD